MPQVRKPVQDGFESGQHAAVFDERNLGLTVSDDIRDLLGCEGVVQADRHAAGKQQRQVRDQVLRTIAHQNGAEPTPLDAERLETVRRAADLVAILTPRERVPTVGASPVQRGPLGEFSDRVAELGEHGPAGDGVFDPSARLLDGAQSTERHGATVHPAPRAQS